jgi:hypothetical protein
LSYLARVVALLVVSLVVRVELLAAVVLLFFVVLLAVDGFVAVGDVLLE